MLVLVLAIVTMTNWLHAASCKQMGFEVHGTVTDRSGQPIPGARVHVLLDKVSQKEFGKQGVRARSVTANDRGGYQIRIPLPAADYDKGLLARNLN